MAITESYTSASPSHPRPANATTIITGLAVSLQATALPVGVIAAGMWIGDMADVVVGRIARLAGCATTYGHGTGEGLVHRGARCDFDQPVHAVRHM